MAQIKFRLATALALPLTFLPLCAFSQDASPTEAYLAIHKKELAAKSYADIAALRSKKSIDDEKAAGKELSKEDQEMFFPMFKMMLPKEVKIMGEQIKGDEATLEAMVPPGSDPQVKETTTGTIKLVKEDGAWKLYSEKWNSKIESTKDLPSMK